MIKKIIFLALLLIVFGVPCLCFAVPDGFVEAEGILLQPNDVRVPYTFAFPICSSQTANDGAVPYGLTIASVAVTGKKINGEAAAALVGAYLLGGITVQVNLTWPGASGKYKLTFVLTFSDGTISKEFDFNRIDASDR